MLSDIQPVVTFTIEARPTMSVMFKNVFRRGEIAHFFLLAFVEPIQKKVTPRADVHTTAKSITPSFFYSI